MKHEPNNDLVNQSKHNERRHEQVREHDNCQKDWVIGETFLETFERRASVAITDWSSFPVSPDDELDNEDDVERYIDGNAHEKHGHGDLIAVRNAH